METRTGTTATIGRHFTGVMTNLLFRPEIQNRQLRLPVLFCKVSDRRSANVPRVLIFYEASFAASERTWPERVSTSLTTRISCQS
jgi:hypothetical protein